MFFRLGYYDPYGMSPYYYGGYYNYGGGGYRGRGKSILSKFWIFTRRVL